LTGSLFEQFVAEIINIKGKWSVPPGGGKQPKTSDITIRWYMNQSVLLESGRLKEYKDFLQIIAAIDPNSECNLGVNDLDSTPPQNASLKNINDFMVNSNLAGVEVLALEDSCAISPPDNNVTSGSFQGCDESVSCDEESVLHNVVKRLDSLTHQFENHRTETFVVLNELVNIYENQKRPAATD
jgi:hypothetical protein